jgi:hypothetical protein
VGRAAAIGAAVIAGIVSLPALLGSDRPPAVPPDVGLTPRPAVDPIPAGAAAIEPPAPPAPKERSVDRRPAKPHVVREHSARPKRSRHHGHHRERPRPKASPPPPPIYAPAPVYVPPPQPGEFRFER